MRSTTTTTNSFKTTLTMHCRMDFTCFQSVGLKKFQNLDDEITILFILGIDCNCDPS